MRRPNDRIWQTLPIEKCSSDILTQKSKVDLKIVLLINTIHQDHRKSMMMSINNNYFQIQFCTGF